ncbi:MAG: glycosyltransferase family 2 protein [Desulfohalobiaceae bacterium]|nr:glycosyltransferase family 2 protein [Desulfohalobiaceae bacterium]
MLVSVVIPAYNRGHMLRRAAASVLSQTHAELELIIVDDGSTDNSVRGLRSWSDRRLRILRQQRKGVSSARNLAIAQARGDMIALLDSDDVWMPDKLERHLAFQAQTGFEVSQCEEVWVRNGTRINPGLRHRKRAGWIFEPSLDLCLVSPSCVLFTPSFWKRVGPFRTDLPACEDYDLWLRASLRYSFGLFPRALVCKYGGHPDQLSRKIIGLDLYRIYSLLGILRQEPLSQKQRYLLQENLDLRLQRYIKGCLKRYKPEEAERVRRLGMEAGIV